MTVKVKLPFRRFTADQVTKEIVNGHEMVVRATRIREFVTRRNGQRVDTLIVEERVKLDESSPPITVEAIEYQFEDGRVLLKLPARPIAVGTAAQGSNRPASPEKDAVDETINNIKFRVPVKRFKKHQVNFHVDEQQNLTVHAEREQTFYTKGSTLRTVRESVVEVIPLTDRAYGDIIYHDGFIVAKKHPDHPEKSAKAQAYKIPVKRFKPEEVKITKSDTQVQVNAREERQTSTRRNGTRTMYTEVCHSVDLPEKFVANGQVGAVTASFEDGFVKVRLPEKFHFEKHEQLVDTRNDCQKGAEMADRFDSAPAKEHGEVVVPVRRFCEDEVDVNISDDRIVVRARSEKVKNCRNGIRKTVFGVNDVMKYDGARKTVLGHRYDCGFVYVKMEDVGGESARESKDK